MSTIKTLSKFYYGTTVTSLNRSIDFDEGGLELQATMKIGTYSPTEFVIEWQRAMNEVGSQVYSCSFNRTTQKMTISAPSIFNLRTGTGSRLGTSAWSTGGFSTGSNKTGLSTYTCENVVGKSYEPQFFIDKYLSPDHSVVKEASSSNSTPAGLVQQVSFGDGLRIQMNIRVITDITGISNVGFVSNPNGVIDAMNFMRFLMTKAKVEFIPNKLAPTIFTKCYLESTPEDKEATKFSLKNMGIPSVYETGVLTFRKVLV